ncbi:hypothetical protein RFI_40280, partial [Reticulomyxa filosa]
MRLSYPKNVLYFVINQKINLRNKVLHVQILLEVQQLKVDQNGFEKYAEKITKEAGITDKEGLKVDFDEVCNLLDLSDEEKDKFKKTVFATNVDEMQ